MRRIIGVCLISALILVSCQKKEEQISQIQQEPPQDQSVSKLQTTTKQQEEDAKPQQMAAVDGKSIFMSKGCGACHQENTDTVGPSIKKIASVYAGDKQKLLSFLKGDSKPIVDPAKESIMRPQVEVTKKLSSQELEALADFIIKH